MNPLISVVIPTFNSASTIFNCLESIRKQEFRNFEVVLIDSDSSDKTLKIAKRFINEVDSLTVISEKDKGIYDAMNKGIQLSKGQWLYFLGSDDTLKNDSVFGNIAKRLETKESIDILYGNVYSEYFERNYDGEFTFKKMTRFNICHQAIFFKKTIFDEIGEFNLKYKVVSDWDHNIKWFFNDKINHKYVDVVTANFADGGFSAKNEDELFQKEKNIIFLKLGFSKLSFFELRRICNDELERLKENPDWLKFVYVSCYLISIRFRRKWNNLIKRSN